MGLFMILIMLTHNLAFSFEPMFKTKVQIQNSEEFKENVREDLTRLRDLFNQEELGYVEKREYKRYNVYLIRG